MMNNIENLNSVWFYKKQRAFFFQSFLKLKQTNKQFLPLFLKTAQNLSTASYKTILTSVLHIDHV